MRLKIYTTNSKTVSHTVLEDEDADLEAAIDDLANIEDSNGKIRLCLMDTQRSISFLQRQLRDQAVMQEIVPDVLRDIDNLNVAHYFLVRQNQLLNGYGARLY